MNMSFIQGLITGTLFVFVWKYGYRLGSAFSFGFRKQRDHVRAMKGTEVSCSYGIIEGWPARTCGVLAEFRTESGPRCAVHLTANRRKFPASYAERIALIEDDFDKTV